MNTTTMNNATMNTTTMSTVAMSPMTIQNRIEPDVRAAMNGDLTAFSRLVGACSSLVCSIALSVLRDKQASEDVAQEVFVAAWKGIPKLRNPDSFLPWLRQLTRNRTFSWRSRQGPSMNRAQAVLEATQDPGPGAHERLLQAEEQRFLMNAIDELPDETREVVTLFYREGQSVQAVADLLGMRQDAVRQRLSRARTRLNESISVRLGKTLVDSAPSATFVMTVTAALAAGTPSTASAATVMAGKAVGATGSSLGMSLAALATGAGLGTFLGWLGFGVGTRLAMREAIDDQERIEWRRMGVVGIVTTALCLAGMYLGAQLHSSVVFAVSALTHIAMMTIVLVVWQPRVLARRWAVELEADPESWRKHRRMRWQIYGTFALVIPPAIVAFLWAALKVGQS